MQGTHEAAFKLALTRQLPIAFAIDAGVFPHGENAREFKLRVGLGQTPLAAIVYKSSDLSPGPAPTALVPRSAYNTA